MNDQPKWARYLGAVAGVLACAAVAIGFATYMCLSSGGRIADFGTSCQITACPDFPTVDYFSPWFAVLIVVFVGIPVYVTVSGYSPRWFRANGKHDG